MLEVSVFIHWCKSQDFSRPPAESLHPSYGAHLLRLLPALGAEVSCLEERRIQKPHLDDLGTSGTWEKKNMTIKQQYHYGTKTLITLNLSLSFSYRFINY